LSIGGEDARNGEGGGTQGGAGGREMWVAVRRVRKYKIKEVLGTVVGKRQNGISVSGGA